MRRCARCDCVRSDASFRGGNTVCKPCHFHPKPIDHEGQTASKDRNKRTHQAIREFVKGLNEGQPFVYLIRANNLFKVGWSANVSRRIAELETASPVQIRLVALAPGGRELEQALHRQLKDYRERREWFRNLNGVLVQAFAELPGAMVFLPGYLTQETPLLSVTE